MIIIPDGKLELEIKSTHKGKETKSCHYKLRILNSLTLKRSLFIQTMMEKQLILTLLLWKPKWLLFLTTSIQSVFQGKNNKSSVVDFFLKQITCCQASPILNLRHNSLKISNLLLSLYFWVKYCEPKQFLLLLGCQQLWNLFPCPKFQRAFNFPALIETSSSERDFLFHRHLQTLLQQKSVTRTVLWISK